MAKWEVEVTECRGCCFRGQHSKECLKSRCEPLQVGEFDTDTPGEGLPGG